MSRLEDNEPRFYEHWLAAQHRDDPQLERWLDMEADQVGYGAKRVADLLRTVPTVEDRDVLDLGCQWGAMCIALAQAGARPTGIDVDEALMEGARVRAAEHGVEATFVTAFGEALPFPDDSFDVVVFVDVIEHVKSHAGTLREIVRVLRPGGYVYVEGPNRLSLGWLRSDPHYQLPGISWMPEWLGRLYVTRVKGFPSYDVGRFAVASVIAERLRRLGCEVLDASDGGSKGLAGLAKFNLRPMFSLTARVRQPTSS